MFVVSVLFAGWVFFFFFQAEDGIRDVAVTGVQTCALPILCSVAERRGGPTTGTRIVSSAETIATRAAAPPTRNPKTPSPTARSAASLRQIGRASCRERV